MSVIAVDLAAKYSAACWMSDNGVVLGQWDSWLCDDERQFISYITQPWWLLGRPPDVMVVEDLPHRLPFAATVKAVCRLQGRIVERMDQMQVADTVLFAAPAEWRKTYDGLARGTGPDAVVPVAAELGYTPPDLQYRTGRGHKAIARKVATDYCAAFLIARWALACRDKHGTFDVVGTARYGTLPVKAPAKTPKR